MGTKNEMFISNNNNNNNNIPHLYSAMYIKMFKNTVIIVKMVN